jgi:hypothetical protein
VSRTSRSIIILIAGLAMLPSRHGHASDATFMSMLHVVVPRRPDIVIRQGLELEDWILWSDGEIQLSRWVAPQDSTHDRGTLHAVTPTRPTLILKASRGDTISPKAALTQRDGKTRMWLCSFWWNPGPMDWADAMLKRA